MPLSGGVLLIAFLAAAGGTGQFAVQIAKLAGNHVRYFFSFSFLNNTIIRLSVLAVQMTKLSS